MKTNKKIKKMLESEILIYEETKKAIEGKMNESRMYTNSPESLKKVVRDIEWYEENNELRAERIRVLEWVLGGG